MTRELATADGRTFRLREVELPPLGAHDVRIRVEFAAPKHGTELHLLGGGVPGKRWDRELRMFLPEPTPPEPSAAPAERGVGNIVVGHVTEVGRGVTRWKMGDGVFAYGPVRELHQAGEAECWSADGLTGESAVCVDPAHVAFVAVRDGNIRIGDTVAVYGLGAIGLMAVRIARAGGARQVFGVDPSAMRRDCARANGADVVFDPAAADAALGIKMTTGKLGVDVAIETSGNGAALHSSIRCIRQCGTVVHVPWGPSDCSALHLDEEFHINRPTILGSQAWAGWECADRGYPLWNHDRAFRAVIELLRSGTVSCRGIVTPVVALEEAPAAFEACFRDPASAIKLGVRVA